MRKFVALALVALLAMTMALALMGCGGQQQESATPEASPMSEPTMQDTSSMADTSAMADTSSMKH